MNSSQVEVSVLPYHAPDKFLWVESQVKTYRLFPLPLSYSGSFAPPLLLPFSKATHSSSFSKIPSMLQTPEIRMAGQSGLTPRS